MIFINNIPQGDPNVKYDGKTYPQDKVPNTPVQGDPNVNYQGGVYPRDKIKYSPPPTDPTNQPQILVIGGYQLPPDTLILLKGEKTITSDAILDGVVVYEHISRKPYDIDFDVVVRELGAIPGYSPGNSINIGQILLNQPFPQEQINDIWTKIWTPNTVLPVQNTYLNGLGILEIVIRKINPATVRGGKNIPVKIEAHENIPGQSLIISSS